MNFSEIDHYLAPKPLVSGIMEGDVVELVAGPFKGEKARVQKIDEAKEEITVELFEAIVPIPVTVRGDHVRVLEKETVKYMAETVEVLVEGGKATPGPAPWPSSGPARSEHCPDRRRDQQKDQELRGNEVPVKIIIDSKTKTFDIKVGTPPTSALMSKELGVEKGSGSPKAQQGRRPDHRAGRQDRGDEERLAAWART